MVRDTSIICYRDLVEQGKVSDNCQRVYAYVSANPDSTDTEYS